MPATLAARRRLSIRLEQFRQAMRIHKGPAGLGMAVMGVRLSRLPIPSRRLRLKLFRDLYARMYPPGLSERDAEHPLDDYRSFNALFTRGVRPEHRPIGAASGVLSPCDGTVQDVGRVEGGRLLTVKGIEYSVASLLAEPADARPFEGGHFAILFLSPIDCHRVFSPVDGRVEAMVHVPGARLLVHPPFQKPEFPVYTLNERVAFRIGSDAGPCAVVMVAGWGVGTITTPLAPEFRPGRRVAARRWPSPPPVGRGDWLATFELGSTVVLFTASPEATPLVSPNEKVLYGQPLFRLDGAARPE